MRLVQVRDRAHRDALMRGELGDLEAAPGWPHDDSAPGLSFLNSGGLTFLILDDEGRIAGECGTKTPPDEKGTVEIGYGLAAPSRSRGLGTTAVKALVEFLSGDNEVRRIEAEVHIGNPPSWRLLERLGFVTDGVETQRHLRYGMVAARRIDRG